MKRLIGFLFLILLFFSGCINRERERAFQKREAALNAKEQELIIKEKSLQVKEEELQQRELLLDSAKNNISTDTITYHPELVGLWSVQMNCTETTCPGYAVGDSKTEKWQIEYQNNNVIAKAIVDQKLARIYSGNFIGSTLQLTVSLDSTELKQAAKMNVQLKQIDNNKLEGRRELIRPEGCRVVYSVQLEKQKKL